MMDGPGSPDRIQQLEARTKMTELSIKKAKGTVDTLIEQSKAQQKCIAQYKLEKLQYQQKLQEMQKLESLHQALTAKYEDCVADNVALRMENSKLKAEGQQVEQLSALYENEKAHGWNQEQVRGYTLPIQQCLTIPSLYCHLISNC